MTLCNKVCQYNITKELNLNEIAFRSNEFDAVKWNEQNLMLLTFN